MLNSEADLLRRRYAEFRVAMTSSSMWTQLRAQALMHTYHLSNKSQFKPISLKMHGFSWDLFYFINYLNWLGWINNVGEMFHWDLSKMHTICIYSNRAHAYFVFIYIKKLSSIIIMFSYSLTLWYILRIMHISDLRTFHCRQILQNGTLYFPPFAGTYYRADVHENTYRCKASNAAGTILSRDVHISAGIFCSIYSSLIKVSIKICMHQNHGNVITENIYCVGCAHTHPMPFASVRSLDEHTDRKSIGFRLHLRHFLNDLINEFENQMVIKCPCTGGSARSARLFPNM